MADCHSLIFTIRKKVRRTGVEAESDILRIYWADRRDTEKDIQKINTEQTSKEGKPAIMNR